MIYTGYFSPLIGIYQNRLEIFNEISVSFITFHMFFFTDWTLGFDINSLPEKYLQPDREILANKKLQEAYGIMMDCFMFFYLTVNISIIWYFSLKTTGLILNKYRNLIKYYLNRSNQTLEAR